jgi:predicted Rossmann-fold nucleotide-binding protein
MSGRQSKALDAWLRRMPRVDDLPFKTDPRRLYRVADLYRGRDPKRPDSWREGFDNRVYRWTLGRDGRPRKLSRHEAVAERLHDTAIGQAITAFLDAPRGKAVGIMGGHDVRRDDEAFASVARTARALRRAGYSIVTGGGPGLMEAGNFGAFMAPFGDHAFDDAVATLTEHPDPADHAAWIASACAVRTRLLGRWDAMENPKGWSLGIPTWYYGAEPPNLFASHSGKYFFNSVREDGLVSVCDGGLIFGAGSAGTVQEVFQDANLNFYRAPAAPPVPMVLLGSTFWNPKRAPARGVNGAPAPKPVYPLLAAMARQAAAPFDDALLLCDDTAEIVDFVRSFGVNRRANETNQSLHKKGCNALAM